MTNLTHAARALGIKGNKSGKPSRVEASRRNGKLGGRPPLSDEVKRERQYVREVERIANAIFKGGKGRVSEADAMKFATEIVKSQGGAK